MNTLQQSEKSVASLSELLFSDSQTTGSILFTGNSFLSDTIVDIVFCKLQRLINPVVMVFVQKIITEEFLRESSLQVRSNITKKVPLSLVKWLQKLGINIVESVHNGIPDCVKLVNS